MNHMKYIKTKALWYHHHHHHHKHDWVSFGFGLPRNINKVENQRRNWGEPQKDWERSNDLDCATWSFEFIQTHQANKYFFSHQPGNLDVIERGYAYEIDTNATFSHSAHLKLWDWFGNTF